MHLPYAELSQKFHRLRVWHQSAQVQHRESTFSTLPPACEVSSGLIEMSRLFVAIISGGRGASNCQRRAAQWTIIPGSVPPVPVRSKTTVLACGPDAFQEPINKSSLRRVTISATQDDCAHGIYGYGSCPVQEHIRR